MMIKILLNGEIPIELNLREYELQKGDRIFCENGKWYIEKMCYDRYKLKANGELEFIGKFRNLE